MVCPFRTNQKVERRYKDFQGNGMYFDIEQTFADCVESECPFYCDEKCLQVTPHIITGTERSTIKEAINTMQYVEEYIIAVGEKHKEVYIRCLESNMKALGKLL